MTWFFFSNLQFTTEPFAVTFYLFGHTINLIIENLAWWLDVPNESDETYSLCGWPVIAQENADAYVLDSIGNEFQVDPYMPLVCPLFTDCCSSLSTISLLQKWLYKPIWSKI
jgi:hypothetical protein